MQLGRGLRNGQTDPNITFLAGFPAPLSKETKNARNITLEGKMKGEMRHTRTVSSEPIVRVYISDWKGKPKLHIRKFAETDTYRGPTKQGIAIPMDNVLELAQGILDAYSEEIGSEGGFKILEISA